MSLLFFVWDALNWRTGGDGAVHEASSPLPDPAAQVSSRVMLMASSCEDAPDEQSEELRVERRRFTV